MRNDIKHKKVISLCLIVAANDEEAVHLDKALKSASPYVDEIVITITGKNEAVENVAKSYDANITYFDWINDFSAARNYNFAQATGDWILWMDADDIFDGLGKLRPLIDEAESTGTSGVFFDYLYDWEGDKVVGQHKKMQLLKNDGHFNWVGAIHEDPIITRSARWTQTQDIKRVHMTTHERGKDAGKRNLAILLSEHKKKPKEPRHMFYLGREYVRMGDFQASIEMLDKYLALSGWDAERYEARILQGECYLKSGMFRDALTCYHEAILEQEGRADAYIMKGMVFMRMEEWSKAI